jgi:hypothetical protein
MLGALSAANAISALQRASVHGPKFGKIPFAFKDP